MMRRLLSSIAILVSLNTGAAADDLSGYFAEAEQMLKRLRGTMMQEM